MSEGLPPPFFANVVLLEQLEQIQRDVERVTGIPRRLLNGSWPLRDGTGYPRFDTTRRQGPLGGYESYVRRSPPATE